MARILLIVVALGLAGYLGYTMYFSRPAAPATQGVSDSFNAFSNAIAKGNQAAMAASVSPSFSDPKLSRADFLNVLAVKRKSYKTDVKETNIEGDAALVSYTRVEQREQGEPFTVQIKRERWVRDPAAPGAWKLQKLAAEDEWMRTTASPEPIAPTAEAAPEVSPLIDVQKEAARMSAMKSGERYNPIGKRNPFVALIDAGMTPPAPKICEPTRTRELLENFDLGSMKLSGIVDTAAGFAALLETPDGKGYTVTAGMHLGKNCGLVTEIRADYLNIIEQLKKPGAGADVFYDVPRTLELRP
jgi:Tfp pilus assembly protein PilP